MLLWSNNDWIHHMWPDGQITPLCTHTGARMLGVHPVNHSKLVLRPLNDRQTLKVKSDLQCSLDFQLLSYRKQYDHDISTGGYVRSWARTALEAFALEPIFVERAEQHHCFPLQYAAVQMGSSLNSVVFYLALGGCQRLRLTWARLLSGIDQ